MVRRCLPVAAAFLLASSVGASAWAEHAFDPRDEDKQAHVAATYSISLTTALGLRKLELPRWKAVLVASAAALAVGTLKEVAIDDEFSWGDEIANGVGVGLSAVIVFTLEL